MKRFTLDKKAGLWGVVAVVLVSLSASACSSSSAGSSGNGGSKVFTIPVITTLSGPLSLTGKSNIIGIQMAINQVNSDGGIDGYKLAYKEYDDAGNSTQSVTYTHEIASSNALLELGPMQTLTTDPAWPIAARAGLPVVGFTQDTDVVAAAKPWAFDCILTGPETSKAAVDQWVPLTHVKNVVAIVDTTNAGSDTSGQQMISAAQADGVNIIKTISIQENQASYSSEAAVVKSLNPDGVIVAGYSTTSGLVLNALRESGVDQPVLVPQSGYDSNVIKIAPKSLQNTYVDVITDPSDPNSLGDNFVSRYDAVDGGVALYPSTPYAYDSVLLIAAALKSSGVLTSTQSLTDRRIALRDALKAVTVNGVTGTFKMSANNDMAGNGIFLKLGLNGAATIVHA